MLWTVLRRSNEVQKQPKLVDQSVSVQLLALLIIASTSSSCSVAVSQIILCCTLVNLRLPCSTLLRASSATSTS